MKNLTLAPDASHPDPTPGIRRARFAWKSAKPRDGMLDYRPAAILAVLQALADQTSKVSSSISPQDQLGFGEAQVYRLYRDLEKLPGLTPAQYAAMKSAQQKKS